MERNLKRFISYGLAISLVVLLSLAISACSSSPSSTPAQSASVTPSGSPSPGSSTTPVATATGSPSPTASASSSPIPQGPPPVISNSSLPDGKVGTSYSQNLQASGGSGSYSWTISADVLPIGLILDSTTGAISGTPKAAATYFFDVTVVDTKSGASANKAFSITIDLDPSATPPATPTPTPTPTSTATPTATATAGVFSITTTSLPAATVGSSYSQSLEVSGGTGPFIWSYWSGSLPDGLKLDASSGIIYGTPTAHGTFSFTIDVMDSAGGIAAGALSLTVNTR